jgi:hypothetical protein
VWQHLYEKNARLQKNIKWFKLSRKVLSRNITRDESRVTSHLSDMKTSVSIGSKLSWVDVVTGGQLAYPSRFVFFFHRTIALLFDMGRPLWREDGSAICSAICQWSESRKTRNHIWLSHLRLLSSLFVASYDSQGLRWKYSYPPPHGAIGS